MGLWTPWCHCLWIRVFVWWSVLHCLTDDCNGMMQSLSFHKNLFILHFRTRCRCVHCVCVVWSVCGGLWFCLGVQFIICSMPSSSALQWHGVIKHFFSLPQFFFFNFAKSWRIQINFSFYNFIARIFIPNPLDNRHRRRCCSYRFISMPLLVLLLLSLSSSLLNRMVTTLHTQSQPLVQNTSKFINKKRKNKNRNGIDGKSKWNRDEK